MRIVRVPPCGLAKAKMMKTAAVRKMKKRQKLNFRLGI
jgi:hypothetical protein